ncbi:MAG TPA: UDP-N-acetylmuramoyl-L-alanyl-D-glutamate--2,6-diaminopimelate ligase [Desulfitobacteriaceae bacterium]|nr:UDP-N-acetylmuramoyl-L-alanyl-D-glutamate--2,6-diaminopimelate ligase [Desulfitobacteriaceae bacterium]
MRVLKVNKLLASLLTGIKVQASSGDLNVLIRGIEIDSRRVKAGDIFVCIPGLNADGHDFAAAAIAAGAAALIVEKFLPYAVPQIQVASARQELGLLAAEVYNRPGDHLELVGVTGTNGKTTIIHLLEKIAVAAGKKVGLIGTLGASIAGRQIPGKRTTPEACEIQRLLAEMLEEKVSLVAMEVSSHALDYGRVQGCEFDSAIFTNLTQDHLDYHKTMEGYLRAKARLFKELKGSKQPKIAVLNRDDPAFPALRTVSAAPVITYGIKNKADYQAIEVEINTKGSCYDVCFRGQRQEIYSHTPGVFNVYNTLAAFAWAVERGYDPQQIAQVLAEIRSIPGRFESIRLGQPFNVIVDYAHTPDGLENVLRTAKDFTTGRLLTVFGCGGDRDKSKRPLMGKVAAQWSDFLAVTSDNPRSEDPEQIIRDILAGVKEIEHLALSDRREAISYVCRLAKPGDTVLIAGKGHETEQIIGDTIVPFDDREVACQALRRLGYDNLAD